MRRASTGQAGGGSPLREVSALFLKLGVIGFGGPAAHIALMRDEVVRRRGWLDDAEFLELVGATNLIPGPNSTELAIHLGHRRAGLRGLVAAGVCFIGPAVVIVGVLAWLYEHHGTSPAVVDLRYGILPVIVAIVGHALVGLGRTALTGLLPLVTAAGGVVGYHAGVHELLLLAAGGLVAVAWRHGHAVGRQAQVLVLGLLPPAIGESARRASISLWGLFGVFLEIGAVLYGSGYVLLAFLQSELVDERGWMTSGELLDAITVGQVTPGPVFTTATFIGWQLDGPAGAAVATLGIFAPSFLFVALLGRLVGWIKAHPAAQAFLDGVIAISLGLMAGVLADLVGDALVDGWTVVLALAAIAVLLRTPVSSAWLILAGAAVGALRLVL